MLYHGTCMVYTTPKVQYNIIAGLDSCPFLFSYTMIKTAAELCRDLASIHSVCSFLMYVGNFLDTMNRM